MSNIRLTGIFKTLSPLSHIGESLSTCTYLVSEPVLQTDGTTAEIFSYSGNALRGQLRDLCASYMLDALGGAQVPLDTFHLLFSGGRIGGEQQVDIARLRSLRRTIPLLALFGGGVGNQILPGKLRISNSYPVCREALPLLPEPLHEQACAVSYRQMTIEKSFSRKDDAKDDRLTSHLQTAHQLLLEQAASASAAKPERDGPAAQMRMTSELLIAGVSLYTEITALEVDEVQLGCLVSGLHAFSRSPVIGGQGNKGHGRVRLTYDLLDLDTGKQTDNFTTVAETCLLSAPAAQAKKAYDQHLRGLYDQMLADNQTQVLHLLEGA